MAEMTHVMVSKIDDHDDRDIGDITELATSVQHYGIMQPILVRPVDGNRFERVFGRRRLAAARKLGMESIPARVEELTDDQVLEMQLVENLQRKNLHPIEEADAYARILELELMSVEDIAAKVGISQTTVWKRLKLRDLGAKQRKAFLEDHFTAGVAMMMARIPAGKFQDEALKELEADRLERETLGVPDVRHLLNGYNTDLRQAPFKTGSTELTDAGPCTICQKRTGNQTDLFGDILDDEGPDVCTDRACYQAKVEATWKLAEQQAKKKGQDVLATKDVYEKSGYTSKKWVRADESPKGAWQMERPKTWRQLIGKTIKPSIVKHPNTGAVVQVFPAAAAKKAIPADVKKVLQGSKTGTTATKKKTGPPAHEVEALVETRWVGAVADAVAEYSDLDVLRVICSALLASYRGLEAAGALGWIDLGTTYLVGLAGTASGKSLTKQVLKQLGQAEAGKVRALAVMSIFIDENVERSELDKQLGIDVAQLRKAAVAELTAQAKADAVAKKKKKAIKKKA